MICPDGCLTTGQGNRFVLASTTELHEKINQLGNRVRQLEDALRASHSQLSTETHPLLVDDLLRIKAPLQREPPSSANASLNSTSMPLPDNMPKEEEEEATNNPIIVDAFGSLSISVSGGVKYYGHIANSWYFLQNENPDDQQSEHMLSLQRMLPSEVLTQAASMPVSQDPQDMNVALRSERLHSLFWFLPPMDRAIELRNTYFAHAAWMYNPISAEMFNNEVFEHFYGQSTSPTSPSDEPLLCHRLSLMFIVLAIGCLMDVTQEPFSLDAEKYYQLSRAALFQHVLMEEPTLHAVQALFLMSFYLFLCDRHGAKTGARWVLMGVATKIAQSIGLHRDTGKWNVDPIETQRRRECFWELFVYDSWQCLTFGRPPSFTLSHIDTHMPYPLETDREHSFSSWKARFTSTVMHDLHDQAFGAKPPSYNKILELDKKMRSYPVPAVLQVAGFGATGPEVRTGNMTQDPVQLTLQRHIVLAVRECNLLYLHRSYFAKAITDHPKDPLNSAYGSSVIAAYRSAGSFVALMRNLNNLLPELSQRLWFLYTHFFSCAIVLGSIVTRCPSMSLAPSALVQLESACDLFSKSARVFRAEPVLGIMLGLQQKARASLDEFRKNKGSFKRVVGQGMDDNDELATLGGKTRLVSKVYQSPSPQDSGVYIERSPVSFNPVIPLPLSPQMDTSQVHPNVIEYLRQSHNQHQLHQQHKRQQQQQQQRPTINPSSPTSVNGYTPTFSSSALPAPDSLHAALPGSIDHQTPTSFPGYFPVFDYVDDMSMAIDAFGSMLESMGPGDILGNGLGGRTSSSPASSPEANIHTTWNDFVNGIAMG